MVTQLLIRPEQVHMATDYCDQGRRVALAGEGYSFMLLAPNFKGIIDIVVEENHWLWMPSGRLKKFQQFSSMKYSDFPPTPQVTKQNLECPFTLSVIQG